MHAHSSPPRGTAFPTATNNGHYSYTVAYQQVAIVGGIGDGATASGVRGLSAVVPAVDAPMSLDEAADRAADLYARAAERLFALLAVGESYRT